MNEVEYVDRGEVYTPPPPTQPPPPVPPIPSSGGGDEPLVAREQPRLRLGPRSLTARIVTGVLALVLLLVLAVGIGTYFSLKYFLGDKLDQQLQQTVNQGANNIFRGSRIGGPSAVEVYVVALDPTDGAVLAAPPTGTRGVTAMTLSKRKRTQLADRDSEDPISVRTADGEQLRVTVLQNGGVTEPNGETVPAKLLIGLSTEDEHETLHRLVYLESIIGGAALLIAIAATAAGVRFSLRRLRAVTTTAQDVASELSPEGAGLDRRVHDTDDTTEVGQLAISFNTMLGAVESQFAARLESERRMRQFLADASHELRTPLTSIRGYAELARMQRAAGDTSEDNLDRIESEGTRMSRLVEDLLTLARGDADDREPQRELIDVFDLADDAASGSRAAFPSRRIDVEISGAPLVVGDRDQLLRVVRNLVTNAAIHTQPDRPIAIRAFADAADVTIQVIDGGPGLPPEDAAHVFERFWRADKARTRARGGSGLGLSIVAAIVRAHGGTVRFDSSVQSGSTVTVGLPAAHQSAD